MSEAIMAFFDNSPDLFAIANYDEKIIVMNNSFTKELGWTFEELTDQSFYNFIPNEYKEKLKKDLFEKKDTVTTFMICKDGTIKKIKWKITYDDEKKYIYGSGRVISPSVAQKTEEVIETINKNNNGKTQ